ncbi:hypothetical protein LCGC14_1365310 [marine sediment metagenome]|uniref:Uncharacterized protein n=1 Tax=marine sediment metagenome TaxID=412755 RepID=A0A0F9KSX2_9ZZZZ
MKLFLRIVKRFFILKGEEISDFITIEGKAILITLGTISLAIIITLNEIILLTFAFLIISGFLSLIIIIIKRWLYSNWAEATEIETDKWN